MADTSPNLTLKRLHEGQDEAEIDFNSNFNLVDALLLGGVIDRDLSAAPAGVNGEAYIVAATPGGGDPWNGWTDDIAFYYDGWKNVTPNEGWRIWVEDENLWVQWDGSAWTAVANIVSHKNAITAFATGGQANATALVHELNRITVVASAGDSVKLPQAVPGMVITVENADSTDSMDTFPFSGDKIDALATDAAYAQVAGDQTVFRCTVALLWKSN